MIVYLAKVFEKQEHADEFIRGEMYCKSLAWFKMLEDGDGRGDTYEGAIVPQLEGLVITLEAKDPDTGEVLNRHTMEGFPEPPVLIPEWFDHIKLFCMFAGHSGDFQQEPSEGYLDRLRGHLQMSYEYVQMGEHAVVIKNRTEFLRRVRKAAHRKGYGIRSGLVKYYDPQVGTSPIQSDIETIFSKRKKYAYQREFRFAIDTGPTEGGAIKLDIGDIRDIAFRTDTSRMSLELRWRPH